MSALILVWRYLWALPTTSLGLIVAALHCVCGGPCQLVDGVLELHGGLVRWGLRNLTVLKGGAAALTLGHVVLGQDEAMLQLTRSHERVHVRQVERWGVFFLPAYLLGSAFAAVRGRRAYFDNPFEIEARRLE